jgi:hypothetical protein
MNRRAPSRVPFGEMDIPRECERLQMCHPPFEHVHVIDSCIVEDHGRKILIIRTTLTLDENGDGFDAAAIDDLCAAFADYAKRHPGIREGQLVRVRH